MLTGQVERAVHGVLVTEARRTGCHVLAVGGVEDHVHLLVWLHPACAIADLVARVKTVSCRTVRATLRARFRWQRGYGAFAVQPYALDDVIRYVRNQRDHHALGTTIAPLERTPHDDEPPPLRFMR